MVPSAAAAATIIPGAGLRYGQPAVSSDPVWAAQQAALGAFVNSGQIRVAVERIYVHRSLAERFVAAMAAEAGTWGKQIGPLVDRRLRDAVHGQVRDALRAGATLVAGGEVPSGAGAYYPPTVLSGCTDEMVVTTAVHLEAPPSGW